MAADLDLLQDFTGGQGAGAQAYVVYAEDLDSNFLQIESQFNVLNAEVRAFAGNNASLILDMLLRDDPSPETTGIVGLNSFAPIAFITADTQIQVPRGVALTSAGRVRSTLDPATLTGSGVSGARFINLDADGTVTLETAAAAGTLDLYSVNWNGSSFDTGTLTRLEEILVEADDFQLAREQEEFGQSTDAVIPLFTYDQIAQRLDDIVRIMGGQLTSGATATPGGPVAPTLAPMAFGGSAALPGFIAGDGTTYDNTTGLFTTPGTPLVGLSIAGTAVFQSQEITANEPSLRLRSGTLLAEPVLAWITDTNSGLGFVLADEWRGISGGAETFRSVNTAARVGIALIDGSAASPSLMLEQSRQTGFHRVGADILGLGTAGVLAAQWNASQQRTSATQGRASATRTTQNIASGTALVNVVLDTAEQYDQGTYHDLVTNPDRMTVPTGFDGVHQITATCSFDESTSASPNVGDRDLAITLNGSVVARSRAQAAGANDTDRSVSVELELVATDIVRMAVAQDSGGTMDVVNSRLTVRLGD